MFLTTAAVVLVSAPAGAASPPAGVASASTFQSFVASLRPDAEARGISRETFDAAFAGVTPDPSVAAMTRRQPEELKTVGAYLAAQVTAGRVAAGKAMLSRWRTDLDAIEARSGVPRSIVIAVWGLETNYGASKGNKDVIRSLATLASIGYRPELYREELLSALSMLQASEVRRQILRGSWAGAMGDPQFMPSSFDKYAVDGDGDGRRDIWGDTPDALASIANFLHRQGWAPGIPWGFEVTLPQTFDIARSRAAFPAFAAMGVVRPDGTPLPDQGDGILLFPAGSKGPAFLVTENYEVLKTYNFSDVYVLSVGLLAHRIDGGVPLSAPWPSDPPISRADRIALQARLDALGYGVDNRVGRISLALRDVIRLAQARVGMPPDGNPTRTLLQALQSAPPKR